MKQAAWVGIKMWERDRKKRDGGWPTQALTLFVVLYGVGRCGDKV